MATRQAPAAVKLAMEVAKIKRSLNVEKKHKDLNLTPSAGYSLAQVYGNSDGAFVLDITPSITQGTDGDQRNGNSCKLTGLALKYQLIGQVNCHSARRLRFMLVKTRDIGNNATTAQVLQSMFDENPLTGVRDLNAPRNYSSMKHHGMSVVRTKTVYMKCPQVEISGTTDAAHSTGSFTAALQDVLRFDGSSDSSPEHVKYFLIVQTDVGNADPTSSSSLDVPVKLNASAVDMRATLRTWWVDN